MPARSSRGRRGLRDVLDQPQRGDRGGHGDQQIHVQAPAPVEPLGEDSAEEQADRRAAAGDRAEDAERLAALGGVAERDGEQRERGRREQRGEDTLRRARGDEHAERPGGAAHRGGGGEAEQAADEGPLAPEQVAELAAEQQQRAERQRVGGDDPLARRRWRSRGPPARWAGRCSRSSGPARSSAARWRSAPGSASGARDAKSGSIGLLWAKVEVCSPLRQVATEPEGLPPVSQYGQLE